LKENSGKDFGIKQEGQLKEYSLLRRMKIDIIAEKFRIDDIKQI